MTQLDEGRMKELHQDLSDLSHHEFFTKYRSHKDSMAKSLNLSKDAHYATLSHKRQSAIETHTRSHSHANYWDAVTATRHINEETVNEMSDNLLQRYSKRSKEDLEASSLVAQHGTPKSRAKAQSRVARRVKGFKLLQNKAKRLREDLNEENTIRHPKNKKAYVSAYKGHDGETNYKASDKHGHLKFFNHHGMDSAMKHAGLNEETIEELSKGKLSKYFDRATNDRTRHLGGKGTRKYFNRMDGSSLALRKIHPDAAREKPKVAATGKHPLEEAMYHGGTAGYQQAKKGDNIHHGVVMVHGVDGNRRIKKIHWADVATFHGQVATPAGASKNAQVRKAKREGWRVDHHIASTNFDTVKASVDNHHKRVVANDKMLRDGAKRRAALKEMTAVEISAEEYNGILALHEEGDPQFPTFYHNGLTRLDEGTGVLTFSHDVHDLPMISRDRSTGKYFAYLDEAAAKKRKEYTDQHGLPKGLGNKIGRAVFKLAGKVADAGEKIHKKLEETAEVDESFVGPDLSGPEIIKWLEGHGLDISKRLLKKLGTIEGDQDYVGQQTKMRKRVHSESVEDLTGKRIQYVGQRGGSYDGATSKKTSPGAIGHVIQHDLEKGTVKIKTAHGIDTVHHREVELNEDHPSGNWFVKYHDRRVSGPHPSEEQAIIYRDNYVTSNPGCSLSEMSIERTDVVNEKENEMLSNTNLLESPATKTFDGYKGRNKKESEELLNKLKDAAEHGQDADDEARELADETNKRMRGVNRGDADIHEEAEDLEEGRRGRPRKDAKPTEGDDPNVIMSLRKAAYSTAGHTIHFKDGSKHTIHSDHASKVLSHFNGLKPHEKEQFQAHVHASHDNLSNYHKFQPKAQHRDVPTERKLEGARTVKKANRIKDRRETIRRIAQKLKAQREAK